MLADFFALCALWPFQRPRTLSLRGRRVGDRVWAWQPALAAVTKCCRLCGLNERHTEEGAGRVGFW